ncbi:hypothetical protein AAHA92_20035 [Salvia divinorum]|uniref:Uncharacterized protein n=1 Tax=Salvia divinorum TaxID=28513 RepID=A0ABD1GFW1_SALDI
MALLISSQVIDAREFNPVPSKEGKKMIRSYAHFGCLYGCCGAVGAVISASQSSASSSSTPSHCRCCR